MITSLLEQDLYKLTMGQAVHFLFPTVQVEYYFINRGNHKFPKGFGDILKNVVNQFALDSITTQEIEFLKEKCPFINDAYLDFLRNFKFDPDQVFISQEQGDLQIVIRGLWETAIFWEVPLMATISELYFQDSLVMNRQEREENNKTKIEAVKRQNIKIADFGLRRRFSYQNQKEVIKDFLEYGDDTLVGTSNVKMAMDFNLKPIGTMAHEFIMAESALRGIRYANQYAMEDWSKVYRGDLGIVLTDTFGVNAFLQDFDKAFAKQFDGVRHDSGCPFFFADKMIKHYLSLGINPQEKTIVFSDGLNIKKIIELNDYCKNKIKSSFGIGTNITNDVGVKPLNMVIKLRKVNDIPVVKISDVSSKATGDQKAIDVVKWIFGIGD